MTLVSRIWQSPTLMTYGSFIAKSLGLVLVLPFLLTRLPTDEIYLWYLFSTIAGFQLFVDVGFSPTFARVIAYAMGGADTQSLRRPKGDASGEPDWASLERIWSTMAHVYKRLSVVWFLLLMIVGTFAVVGPMAGLGNPVPGWLSWAFVVFASVVAFGGLAYSSYLQGVNEIALLRRWEIVTATGSAITSVIVIIWTENLLALVLVHYGWVLLTVARNRWLARRVHNSRLKSFRFTLLDRTVMSAVWPSTWRTGLGVVMSFGIVQSSGVIYAQIATPAEAVSYFLALRLIQALSQFSQAPFYSKLPMLASMYSAGRRDEMILRAQEGMKLSYISFFCGFVLLGFTGDRLLESIGSNAEFPSPALWGTLGLAYFIERFGAMHINLYSVTNSIVNHVANGVSGVIYVVVGSLAYGFVGILAFPLALIAGNAGFYAWYAASHSYRAFDLEFPSFEIRTMAPLLFGVMFCGVIATIF